MEMVNCSRYGMPMVRDGCELLYFCKSERCPLVFVQAANNRFGRKVAFTTSVTKEIARKTQETMLVALTRLGLIW